MNHSFQETGNGLDICGKCKYPRIQHSSEAVCETCPNIGPVEIRYGNMLMCNECWTRESKLSSANMTPAMQNDRIAQVDIKNATIQAAREIDNSIEVRTDLFNAATVAIIDMKNAIDTDDTITNKPYVLASELINRFNHFKQVVFELNQQLVEAGNEQKAIQVYLNNMSNTLRTEEREKLKIADINYKPNAVKIVKPKTITTSGTKKSTKIDKVALRKYATELGISEFMLQQIAVGKGVSVEVAASIIAQSIAESKTQ